MNKLLIALSIVSTNAFADMELQNTYQRFHQQDMERLMQEKIQLMQQQKQLMQQQNQMMQQQQQDMEYQQRQAERAYSEQQRQAERAYSVQQKSSWQDELCKVAPYGVGCQPTNHKPSRSLVSDVVAITTIMELQNHSLAV